MNPLLIMALLSAASAAANYKGQQKVDQSRANAINEETRRRKEAERIAAQSAQSTTQLFTNAGKNQDAKAAEIEAQYAAHTTPPPGTPSSGQLSSFTPPPGSTLTVEDDQRLIDRAHADTDALAHAKAGLTAYGDAMVGANIGANRNQSDINQQNANVRNWNQDVLPAQLASAGEAGKRWGTLADALQIAAAIYGPIGLSKGTAAAGGAQLPNSPLLSVANTPGTQGLDWIKNPWWLQRGASAGPVSTLGPLR